MAREGETQFIFIKTLNLLYKNAWQTGVNLLLFEEFYGLENKKRLFSIMRQPLLFY